MDSLFHIQYEVESAIREHLRETRRTLWDELVESSVRIDSVGCDGILMREVESYTERLLSKMSDGEMRRLWLWIKKTVSWQLSRGSTSQIGGRWSTILHLM